MTPTIGGGGGGGGSGAMSLPEQRIPDEVMAVMPADPYEQLDLARKITSLAIASRVSILESETRILKQKLLEKESLVSDLQGRIEQIDRVREEAEARLRLSLDENVKLARERDTLAQTSKKLTRDLAKLETFKRQLMQSLNDDNSHQQETVDIRTCDQSIAKVSSWKDGLSLTSSVPNSENQAVTQEAARPPTFPVSRINARPTPGAASAVGSPRSYSTSVSPKLTSGATSPVSKQRFEGPIIPLSPWIPSSKQSSAANSPPRNRNLTGRTPRIDGKEFFRQARSRLSYEQFAAFLANIKELNAHKQSREETLKKADEIFGPHNKDLFLSFKGLLNRNMA
ncbi:hypothetical protein LUZ60_001529 [Juncus effusus]|nr:hypothetical protein LUZ60_001529 [Juncus effusus]